MKSLQVITTTLMSLGIVFLGYQVYCAAQKRFADTIDTADLQYTSVQIMQESSTDNLDQRVYEYLLKIGTDKNGNQTPLKIWGKTIDEIGQDDLKHYVHSIVAITSEACAENSFPSHITCDALMLSLFLQESQLYTFATSPYAVGIAQLGIETAVDYDLTLLQGPKYVAWMTARAERLKYYGAHNLDTSGEKREYQDIRQKENTAREAYRKALFSLVQEKFKHRKESELLFLDERYDPECAIPVATAVMSELLNIFDGDTTHALHAYSYGIGNFRSAQDTGTPIPQETVRHAQRIHKIYGQLNR